MANTNIPAIIFFDMTGCCGILGFASARLVRAPLWSEERITRLHNNLAFFENLCSIHLKYSSYSWTHWHLDALVLAVASEI